jgi:hypothetical protein
VGDWGAGSTATTNVANNQNAADRRSSSPSATTRTRTAR